MHTKRKEVSQFFFLLLYSILSTYFPSQLFPVFPVLFIILLSLQNVHKEKGVADFSFFFSFFAYLFCFIFFIFLLSSFPVFSLLFIIHLNLQNVPQRERRCCNFPHSLSITLFVHFVSCLLNSFQSLLWILFFL